MTKQLLSAFAFVGLVGAACVPAGGNNSGGDVRRLICEEGRTQRCECADGSQGVSTCVGGSLTQCVCGAQPEPDGGLTPQDGGPEVEDGGVPDATPDMEDLSCTEPESRPCGFNGRGEQPYACVDGMLVVAADCVDPDVCADGSTEEQTCGVLGNGTRDAFCDRGQWTGVCEDPDEICDSGATQQAECGLNRRGLHERTCVDTSWSEFGPCNDPDECVDDSDEESACGLNGRGTHERSCTRGQWAEFSPCDDTDVCPDGDVQGDACGLNGRGRDEARCVEGQWGEPAGCQDPDVCTDADFEAEDCGLNDNGERRRTCTRGQWGGFGACDDDDVCRNGSREDQACGLNGRGEQTRACNNGQWGAFSPCMDQEVCVDGDAEERACGLNNGGTQSRGCIGGVWAGWTPCNDPHVCRNGATEEQDCGLNGRGERSRLCVQGQWGGFGACADNDVCRDNANEQRVCGLNERGAQSRTCNNGQWSLFGACDDDDVCRDDQVENQDCEGGTRSRRCAVGQWGEFTPCGAPECDEGILEDRACNIAHGRERRECVGRRWTPWTECLPPGLTCEQPTLWLEVEPGLRQFTVNTAVGVNALDDASCGSGGDGKEAIVVLDVAVATTVTVTVTAGVDDTLLHVRRADCANAVAEVLCDDDGGEGLLSAGEFAALPGRYFIVIDYYSANDGGETTFTIESPEGPCADGTTQEQACSDGATRSRLCIGEEWSLWGRCDGDTPCPDGNPECLLCTDAREVNDTREEASLIEAEDFVESNLCGVADSTDWLGIALEQPAFVEVFFSHDAAAAPFPSFTVHDPAGQLHTLVEENDTSFGLLDRAGTWYVQVGVEDFIGSVDYTLEVFPVPVHICGRPEADGQPCHLCDQDAHDGNDVLDDASPVALGEVQLNLAVCDQVDPEDWYVSILADPGTLAVELMVTEGEGLPDSVREPILRIVDPMGMVVAEGNDGVFPQVRLRAEVEAGAHYVQVLANSGIQTYELLIRQE